MNDAAGPLSGFIPTKPFRQFVEFCTACRRQRSIGLCFGAPGVGKTVSARDVSGWDQVEPLLPYLGYASLPGPLPAALADRRAVFYTAPVVNSPRQIERDLQRLSRRVTQSVARGQRSQRTGGVASARRRPGADRRPIG
jgi:hypothetical protein